LVSKCSYSVMVGGLLASSGGSHAWEKRGEDGRGFLSSQSDRLLRMCFRRGSANFFIAMIGVCALVYIMVYIITAKQVILDDTYGRAGIGEKAKNTLQEHEIDRACSTITGLCYRVVDSVIPGLSSSMVRRQLFTEGADEGDAETTVMLIPPREEDTFESSDTRFWSASHRRILNAYVSALAAAPFVMGPVPLVEEQPRQRPPYQILSIGLGGGNLDMFWTGMKRNLNITVIEKDEAVVKLANEWFGVKEVRREGDATGDERRTILGDGIDYMKMEKKRGLSYDVIVVDACDLDKRRPCPVNSFLSEEMIRVLDSITSPAGIVVFNVLPTVPEKEIPAVVHEVVTKLLTAFNSCSQMSMKDEDNVVVTCTKKLTSGSKDYAQFLLTRMRAAMRSLGLDDVIGDIVTGKRR
ncbi:hypothetical protein PFISCL1PPCAC_24890, partial [Pristionchus fissidentatus]